MSPPLVIRDVTAHDHPAILALNLEFERYLSPLDAVQLAAYDALSDYHRVACVDGAVAGFLLAMREGTGYDGVNYRWFAQRYAQFLYVDRVVIAQAHQGLHVGSRLYADLCAHARSHGVARVTLEYDIQPPNEGSRRFHERLGFREVGRQHVAGGHKLVSLQELPL